MRCAGLSLVQRLLDRISLAPGGEVAGPDGEVAEEGREMLLILLLARFDPNRSMSLMPTLHAKAARLNLAVVLVGGSLVAFLG